MKVIVFIFYTHFLVGIHFAEILKWDTFESQRNCLSRWHIVALELAKEEQQVMIYRLIKELGRETQKGDFFVKSLSANSWTQKIIREK